MAAGDGVRLVHRERSENKLEDAARPAHRREVSTINMNMNVNWMDYPGAWSFYVLAVAIVWFCFFVLDGFESGYAWTYTHMVHAAITFYLFHWKKVRTRVCAHARLRACFRPRARAPAHGLTPLFAVPRRLRAALLARPSVSPRRPSSVPRTRRSRSQGSPINDDQGQFDDLTFWEQIDCGVHWTGTKKFLAGVPIVLCLLASNPYTGVPAEKDDSAQLFINTIVALVLVIAKVPEMHKVRLLGINKGIPTQ